MEGGEKNKARRRQMIKSAGKHEQKQRQRRYRKEGKGQQFPR